MRSSCLTVRSSKETDEVDGVRKTVGEDNEEEEGGGSWVGEE